MSNDIIWVASFDIGKKNFAFYIEEIDITEILNLPKIDKNKRYNLNGTITDEFKENLNKIYLNGKNILFENLDITKNCQKNSYLELEMFYNMTEMLDLYEDFWKQCDIFLVEQQMSFGKNRNTMALKLGQHCQSYFSIKYGRNVDIIEFPAYNKTNILGAEKIYTGKGKNKYKTIDKPARKKWSIEKAKDIFTLRNDLESLEIILSSRKKDDLADVLCQLQAFKVINWYK